MPATKKEDDEAPYYVLTPATLPPRKSRKYATIIEAFEISGEETMLVEGPITTDVKVDTLITSLTNAKKGKPISVRRDGNHVYLQRKPIKS